MSSLTDRHSLDGHDFSPRTFSVQKDSRFWLIVGARVRFYYSSPGGETRRHSLPKSQAFSLIYNSDQYQQQLLFAFLYIYYSYIFVTLVKYFSKLHFEL